MFRSAKTRQGDTRLLFWVHTALLVACVQAPYYEITERMPFMFAASALLYRRISEYESTPVRVRQRRLVRPSVRRAPVGAGAAAG